jgi:hypothetical protein
VRGDWHRDERVKVTAVLPSEGCFVVAMHAHGAPFVQETGYCDGTSWQGDATHCRILCNAVRTIEACRLRVGLLKACGVDAEDGFAFAKTGGPIRQGGALARRYLSIYDEYPDKTPRDEARAPPTRRHQSPSFAGPWSRLPARTEVTMRYDRTADGHGVDEAEAGDFRETLAAIEAQGRQTLELVRALVALMMPKEGGREAPSLEDLLAQLIMQQREAIEVGQATREDLHGFARALPDAVAEALEGRADGARNGRSC